MDKEIRKPTPEELAYERGPNFLGFDTYISHCPMDAHLPNQ